jgi:RNA polymerase sigma-70 factor (ECF subfamily)
VSAESDFERLLDQHKGILYRMGRLYGGPAGSDDLMQEIALQLWRSLSAYRPDAGKLSTWIYRVALNVAISHQRRERVRQTEPLEPLIQAAGPTESDDVRMLYRWIAKLDRPGDKALLLLYLEGQSHREIAEILGITEANAATRLSRLKDAMRKELVGYGS